MGRSLIALEIALVALGAFAGGLAWRAALFLIRPGDLTDRATTGRQTDEYLFERVRKIALHQNL